MAKDGWLTMRNIPKIKTSDGNSHFRNMANFFDSHRICSNCNGNGFTMDKTGPVVDMECVRFQGIYELEVLSEDPNFNLSATIRNIMHYIYWNKKFCKKCSGFGFTEKKILKAV